MAKGIQSPQEIQAIAKRHGLDNYNTCTCGGTYTEKFDDGSVWMEWKPGRYIGRFRKRNSVLMDWTTAGKLEKYIDEYFQTKDAV